MRSRWLTPINVAPAPSGDLELVLVVDLDEHVEAELDRQRVELGELGRTSSAAAISSTQSAPISRASATSSADTVKSLRSTGSEHGSRGGLQVGRRPAEELLVGEHRQARGAAVARRSRASVAGSRSRLRSPFDGERRLISLITASPVELGEGARGSHAVAGSDAASATSVVERSRVVGGRARGGARGSDRDRWPSCDRSEPEHVRRHGVDHVGDRHPHLLGRVAVADRDGVVLERVEVDGDAQRRADLVLAAVPARRSPGSRRSRPCSAR